MNRRIISISILLVLLVSAIAIVATRWRAWFYNPPEPIYYTPDYPTRVLLTFGETYLDRNVSFVCGQDLVDMSVELEDLTDQSQKIVCNDAHGERFRSRSGESAYYYSEFKNLIPGHNYRYTIQSDKSYYFSIPDTSRHHTRFIFFGDIQDTIGGCANQWLKSALANAGPVDFVVSGGDLCERPTDVSWNQTFLSIDSIGQTLPVLTCTGNHDYLKGLTRKLERRFVLTHSYFDKSQYKGNMVYSMTNGVMRMILLDSNRGWLGLSRQRQWLESELKERTEPFCVVVVHHPMYSIRNHDHLLVRKSFDELIRKYHVDLVLQGHEHAYGRLDDNGHAPFYTISHCSPKKYSVKSTDDFCVWDTVSDRFYQVIDVCDTSLVMSAFSDKDVLVDHVEIKK